MTRPTSEGPEGLEGTGSAGSVQGAAGAPDLPYDVFVSYRHREPALSWVRHRLVPGLRQRGLRVCLDVDSFRLGAPLVLEMERAVVESRCTLAVLTPAYLDGTFTELENVLAEHLGLETAQRRLIMVLREPCEPKLRLRARMWLDLTADDELEAGCDRLAGEIRSLQPPPR
ncbi:hypothetical protein CcI49_18175 [Frankia sp. CcI49]|uniref:toll/interleukin-1 receptor domain-containing protein n=1 Tax=Frankia sp. CcI49 TaxID=1745382 RepID=UPI0009781D1B|nr:toll/interleukin-1 receptor domain-containing protein [Frankia sp. CcI49]ONH59073.1 hypothetical protein CcI49_18175 [Frankia sp. CcI49]